MMVQDQTQPAGGTITQWLVFSMVFIGLCQTNKKPLQEPISPTHLDFKGAGLGVLKQLCLRICWTKPDKHIQDKTDDACKVW